MTRTTLSAAAVSTRCRIPRRRCHLKDGLLDLEPAGFSLLQFDVDGAGLKVMNFARSLSGAATPRRRVDPVTRHEDELGAPALRTAGLMLVQRAPRGTSSKTLRREQDAQHQARGAIRRRSGERRVASRARTSCAAIASTSGIRSRANGNRSAVAPRATSWTTAPVVVEAVPEEESDRSPRGDEVGDPDQQRRAPVSARSAGVVDRVEPGRAAARAARSCPTTPSTRRSTQTEAEMPPGLKFTSRFRAVKGSLPRLRFGRTYWIRARAVDLAGNSLEPQAGTFGPETARLAPCAPYLRYEPIDGADHRAARRSGGTIEKPAEGESMARIAIRSFNDTPDRQRGGRRLRSPSRRRAATRQRPGCRAARQARSAPARSTPRIFNLLAHQKDVDPRDASAADARSAAADAGAARAAPVGYDLRRVRGGARADLPAGSARLRSRRPGVRSSEHRGHARSSRIPLYPARRWPEARPFVIERLR